MTKRTKYRLWAMFVNATRRNPRGGLLEWTIRPTRTAAMDALGPATLTQWPTIRKRGYRVARVTVSEIE